MGYIGVITYLLTIYYLPGTPRQGTPQKIGPFLFSNPKISKISSPNIPRAVAQSLDDLGPPANLASSNHLADLVTFFWKVKTVTFKTFWGSKKLRNWTYHLVTWKSLRVFIADFDNNLFVRELLMDVNGTLFV